MKRFNWLSFSAIVMLLLLNTVESAQESLSAQDSLSHTDHGCLHREGYSACYDDVGSGDQPDSKLSNSFFKAFMEQRDSFEEESDVGFRAHSSCELSVEKKFNLLLPMGISASVILIRPNSCKSTGNVLGFFYEMISFGLANGYIIGRLDPIYDAKCNANVSNIENYLPRLIVPTKLALSHLNAKMCKTINMWPWQSPESYFWTATRELEFINSKMMRDYSLASIPEYRNMIHHPDSNSLGIHYRCGDNFAHHHYGVYPFRIYREILTDIFSKVNVSKITIYSDAKKDRTATGELCWDLLGELQKNIENTAGYQNAPISIQFSSPSYAIAMLHASQVVICAVSTFCFFGSFGSDITYLPGPIDLIKYPASKGRNTFSDRIIFETILLRPADFRNSEEFMTTVHN